MAPPLRPVLPVLHRVDDSGLLAAANAEILRLKNDANGLLMMLIAAVVESGGKLTLNDHTIANLSYNARLEVSFDIAASQRTLTIVQPLPSPKTIDAGDRNG